MTLQPQSDVLLRDQLGRIYAAVRDLEQAGAPLRPVLGQTMTAVSGPHRPECVWQGPGMASNMERSLYDCVLLMLEADPCPCWRIVVQKFEIHLDIALSTSQLLKPAAGPLSLSEMTLVWYELANRFVDDLAVLVAEETPPTWALWRWCQDRHAAWASSAFVGDRDPLQTKVSQHWRHNAAQAQLVQRRSGKLMYAVDSRLPFAPALPVSVQVDRAAQELSWASSPEDLCRRLASLGCRPSRRLLEQLTQLNEAEAAAWLQMHWVAVDALDPDRTSWPREYSPLEPLALTALGFWKALPRPDRPCFVQLPAPVASFVDALPEVTDAGPVLAGDPLDLLVYAVELVEGDIAPAKALETIRMLAAR